MARVTGPQPPAMVRTRHPLGSGGRARSSPTPFPRPGYSDDHRLSGRRLCRAKGDWRTVGWSTVVSFETVACGAPSILHAAAPHFDISTRQVASGARRSRLRTLSGRSVLWQAGYRSSDGPGHLVGARCGLRHPVVRDARAPARLAGCEDEGGEEPRGHQQARRGGEGQMKPADCRRSVSRSCAVPGRPCRMERSVGGEGGENGQTERRVKSLRVV